MVRFSPADLRVLRLLQKDLSISRQAMADSAGLSASTLWRRIGELEAAGVVRKQVALLDPIKVGCPVCVFVSVDLVDYEDATRISFEQFIETTAEVMECYAMTGTHDYILLVRATGVDAFEQFLMQRVLRHPAVREATSQIALRQLKYETALPLPADR